MGDNLTLSELLLLEKQRQEREIGKSISLTQFAKGIGFSVSLVSHWMNEKGNPSQENINKLAETIGLEVYDALNLPRPDPRIRELQEYYDATPPSERDWLLEKIEEILIEQGWLLAGAGLNASASPNRRSMISAGPSPSSRCAMVST